MSRSLAALAGSVAALAALSAGMLIGSATDLPTPGVTAETLAAYTLATVAEFPDAFPECATEDSTNCAWDAATQGNGEGHSFVTIGDNYELVF